VKYSITSLVLPWPRPSTPYLPVVSDATRPGRVKLLSSTSPWVPDDITICRLLDLADDKTLVPMCHADNVYYTYCGCWRECRIRSFCAVGETFPGKCKDVVESGVLRVEGVCPSCLKKENQAKRYSLAVPDRPVSPLAVMDFILCEVMGPRPSSAESQTISSHACETCQPGLEKKTATKKGTGRNVDHRQGNVVERSLLLDPS
jgi:hypothetical protein